MSRSILRPVERKTEAIPPCCFSISSPGKADVPSQPGISHDPSTQDTKPYTMPYISKPYSERDGWKQHKFFSYREDERAGRIANGGTALEETGRTRRDNNPRHFKALALVGMHAPLYRMVRLFRCLISSGTCTFRIKKRNNSEEHR